MYLKTYTYLLIITLCFPIACKKDNRKAEAEKIVTEWTGKKISFPSGISCTFMGKDTVCPDVSDNPYKILLYTDSIGCTSCKLKLSAWKNYIREADSLATGKVGFLFYFQPKNEKELLFLFKRDKFEQPVYMDTENKLNKLNNFPSRAEFQCFLLDKDNKVLLVGNPTLNPKIWELYKQIITGEKETKKEPVTTVFTETTEKEINGMKVGETTKTEFVLKNTGDFPLLIKNVDASCGCTVPDWEKKPVPSGKETRIAVEVTPENTGFFKKTIKVYCNAGNNSIALTIKGNVN